MTDHHYVCTLAISMLSNGFGWPRDVITGFGAIRSSGGGGNVWGTGDIDCCDVGANVEWRTGIVSRKRSVCGVDDIDENRNLFGTT